MNSQEEFDRILEKALGEQLAPTMSSDFEARLEAKLGARGVARHSRRPLLIYSGTGLLASVLAMIFTGMDWRVSAISILVPSVATIPVVRTCFLR